MKNQKHKLGAKAVELANQEAPVEAVVETPVEPVAAETAEATTEPLTAAKQPRSHKHRWLRLPLFTLGPVLAIVLVVWILGAVYLTRFKVGSQTLVAHLSNSVLEQGLSAATQSYKLALSYPNGSTSYFPLKATGVQINTSATVTALRHQQHRLSHELEWWHPISGSLTTSVNATVLNNFIATSATVTVQPAKDATLTITNGIVQLSDASAGKEYGLANATKTIATQVANLQTSALHLQTLALNPAITDQELATSKAELDKALQQHITFAVGGVTVSPSPNDIAAWLELTPEDKDRTVNISVNSGKVLAYINQIAANYIRPPKAEVDITRTDGTKAVLVAGVSGIDVVNKDSVATNVAQSLLAGKGLSINLPVDYAAYQTISAGDYPKWIEVDLTNKRMYAYEESTLVRTFLVSAGAPATPTVTGQYAIYAKYTQQNMTGLNVDGSSYFQPNVPWVNYFYKDFAIHGNYWRPLSYFGNINSSHGCVGVTPSDGEWVYNWAPIGTQVIVHT